MVPPFKKDYALETAPCTCCVGALASSHIAFWRRRQIGRLIELGQSRIQTHDHALPQSPGRSANCGFQVRDASKLMTNPSIHRGFRKVESVDEYSLSAVAPNDCILNELNFATVPYRVPVKLPSGSEHYTVRPVPSVTYSSTRKRRHSRVICCSA